jgi:hypothetical protein
MMEHIAELNTLLEKVDNTTDMTEFMREMQKIEELLLLKQAQTEHSK